jgi:alkyl sulfatase BDS1-like metallo-beta-lactamase superfamily hydrolase
MLMYFPQFKALCAAEDACHTLHNLYTLRGAKIRDASKWWKTLDLAIDLFGSETEVLFAQHNWPRWGNESVLTFLRNQRDGYKYLLDQTLRLANQGHTPNEIGEMVRFPPALARQWYLRGYYGTVSHNVKGIYQFYPGWYDGNPANLNPHPPADAGKRYVEYMGGAENVMRQARASFEKSDYRWVAEVLKHVVFAEPENQEARNLQADALEQLGYQAESGPWRSAYLMGAYELRNGLPERNTEPTANPDTIAAMTTEMMLDFTGMHLNSERAEGKTLRINWKQPDSDEAYALSVENSVFIYKKGKLFDKPDATITLPRTLFMALVGKRTALDEEVKAGRATVTGSVEQANSLFGLMDFFTAMFPIVTP